MTRCQLATSLKSKRNYPEHNTPPQQGNKKSNDPKLQELDDSDGTTLQYICDRCTDSVDDQESIVS